MFHLFDSPKKAFQFKELSYKLIAQKSIINSRLSRLGPRFYLAGPVPRVASSNGKFPIICKTLPFIFGPM